MYTEAVQADGEAPVDTGEPPAKKPRTLAPKFAPAELQVSPEKGQMQRREIRGNTLNSAAGKPGNQHKPQPGAKGSSSMVTVTEASGWGWPMRTVIETVSRFARFVTAPIGCLYDIPHMYT